MGFVIDIEKDGLYQRGVEKGIEKGIEEGIEKEKQKSRMEKLQIAKTMKQSGVAVDIIARSFGLTIEEVAKL